MDTTSSKILCPISPLVVRNTFSVPVEISLKSREYNKESIVQYFRESIIEKKHDFFKSCFKPNVELQIQPFPIDANLFDEETQCVITLMSQFLGLDTDKYSTKPLMSLMFVISTCPVESEESSQLIKTSFLKFDEFLDGNIHSQLMDFHKTKTFRF